MTGRTINETRYSITEGQTGRRLGEKYVQNELTALL